MTVSLPDTIASPQDLTSVIGELKLYTQWFVHESIRQRVTKRKTRSSTEPVLSEPATTLIQSVSSHGMLNRQALDQLVKSLEATAQKATTVTFTLAAPVTQPVKLQLVGWCRKNLGQEILVTFQHNSSILGGVVMRYKSRVFDWSFKQQLFANAAKFPEVLRRV